MAFYPPQSRHGTQEQDYITNNSTYNNKSTLHPNSDIQNNSIYKRPDYYSPDTIEANYDRNYNQDDLKYTYHYTEHYRNNPTEINETMEVPVFDFQRKENNEGKRDQSRSLRYFGNESEWYQPPLVIKQLYLSETDKYYNTNHPELYFIKKSKRDTKENQRKRGELNIHNNDLLTNQLWNANPKRSIANKNRFAFEHSEIFKSLTVKNSTNTKYTTELTKVNESSFRNQTKTKNANDNLEDDNEVRLCAKCKTPIKQKYSKLFYNWDNCFKSKK